MALLPTRFLLTPDDSNEAPRKKDVQEGESQKIIKCSELDYPLYRFKREAAGDYDNGISHAQPKDSSRSPINVRLWTQLSFSGLRNLALNGFGFIDIEKTRDICKRNIESHDEFLIKKHQRYPIDTPSNEIKAYLEVHRNPRGKALNRAWWQHHDGAVYFGKITQDSPYKEDAFSTNLDVVSHELGHAYVYYYAGDSLRSGDDDCGGLNYYGQSGALNESMADIIAIMTRHFKENLYANGQDTDWTIARGVYKEDSSLFLRSMANPESAHICKQASKVENYQYAGGDNGGVHFNAGIPSKAFYLAASRLQGPCWDQIGKIWLNALSNSQPNEKFASFAQLTVKFAKQDLGEKGEAIVRSAWFDVGVTPGEETIIRNPKYRFLDLDIQADLIPRDQTLVSSNYWRALLGLTASFGLGVLANEMFHRHRTALSHPKALGF